MKKLFIIAAGLVLAAIVSGCAGLQQAMNGYESAAASGLDAANDNAVKVWKYQVCATPFSAAIRNPDVIPALRALCVPAGGSATASSLLDAATATQPAPKS